MDHVETMARAMCVAEGHDPDQPMPGSDAFPVEPAAPARPLLRWHVYEPQARRLVEVQTDLLAGS